MPLDDAAEDADAFDADMIATELAPVLRRKMEQAALDQAYKDFSKRE